MLREWWIQKIGKRMTQTKIECWRRAAQVFLYVSLLILAWEAFQASRGHTGRILLWCMALIAAGSYCLFLSGILVRLLQRGQICLPVLLDMPVFRKDEDRTESTAMGRFLYGYSHVQLKTIMEEMQSRLEESFDKEKNLRWFQVQAQINALQSQINPHFLYNALEVMRSYAYQAKAYQAAEMAEALSTMFRYSVGKADEMCTVAEEMENISNYFVIQHYRYHDRFSLKFLFDPEDTEIMLCQIPRLSIQPIVENAVHHGLEKKLGKGQVTVRIYTTQDRLLIRVMDDGVGIAQEKSAQLNHMLEMGLSYVLPDSAKKDKNTHIALININQRIKLYFGEEFGVSLSSAPDVGTVVEVVLPRKYAGEEQEGGTQNGDNFTGISAFQTV